MRANEETFFKNLQKGRVVKLCRPLNVLFTASELETASVYYSTFPFRFGTFMKIIIITVAFQNSKMSIIPTKASPKYFSRTYTIITFL